jgi:hypothetical protein
MAGGEVTSGHRRRWATSLRVDVAEGVLPPQTGGVDGKEAVDAWVRLVVRAPMLRLTPTRLG